MSQKQEIAVSDGLSTYMLATSIYGHAQLMQQDLEHRPDGDKHQLQNARNAVRALKQSLARLNIEHEGAGWETLYSNLHLLSSLTGTDGVDKKQLGRATGFVRRVVGAIEDNPESAAPKK